MSKYLFFVSLICFVAGTPAKALNDIDQHILSHCGDECNGESPNCHACYNEAVDLFEPDSPEIDFDIDNDQGKLELEF